MERKIIELIEKRIEEYENAETGAHGEVDTPRADSYARVIKFTFSEANWMVNRIKMLVIRKNDLQEQLDYDNEDQYGRVDSV
tara:strand:- start:224 stop:469 length:246 start_codon:yes stop_codon:yes gene_type:complete